MSILGQNNVVTTFHKFCSNIFLGKISNLISEIKEYIRKIFNEFVIIYISRDI